MNRKKSIVLIVLVLAMMIPGVYAKNPIENIEIIQDLPDVLIAGNIYEMLLAFDNVVVETIPLVVEILVTSEDLPLGYGEILVEEISLNNGELFFTDIDEIDPGFFRTEDSTLSGGSSNNLTIVISTLFNLAPGTYVFEVNLLGEEVFDYVEVVSADIPITINATGVGVVLEDFTSSDSATVTIDLYEYNPYPNVTAPSDSLMAMGIYLEINTNATEFTTTIKVFYTHEDLDGIEESSLRLYYFSDPEWVQCNITGVNTVENYIWANVTHFTVFAPFGSEVEPEPEPSPPPSPPPRPSRNKKPIADASFDQSVYVWQIVTFSGVGSKDIDGTIISYEWDFGDGLGASGVNVSHIYTEQGNYTVILTVKDNRYGTDTDISMVTVMELPEPIIPPLPPILSNLTVAPEEIEIGDEITISLDIKNVDNQSIEYIVTIQISELVLLVDVELEPYESKTISRAITPDLIGIYDVLVDGLTSRFTVNQPIIPPKPAEFEVSELLIEPDEAEPGDKVTISILVMNIGEELGDYNVTWDIGGLPTTLEVITLDGGGSKRARKEVSFNIEGMYTVNVSGLVGIFVVAAPPEPPKPAEFVLSNFTYISEIQEGEPFELNFDVINVGETAGEFVITIKIDGEVAQSLDSYLEPGGVASKTWVTLHVYEVGEHTIQLDGFEGTFVVQEIPAEPVPFWKTPEFFVVSIFIIIILVGAGYIYFKKVDFSGWQ